MMLDPINGSGEDIAELVAGHQISARDIARRCLERVTALDGAVNAYTDILSERALAEADAVDAAVAAGERPPLAGVPYAVKNLFALKGVTTRAGSKINRDDPPANRDATVIDRLSRAGAVCVGALNMGEYAYDFTGRNAHDGDCHNPHALSRMTGGSSSGAAAAVAAGTVAFALGTDTNGSVRVPASYCGVFGFKPTYGRLSRSGVYPLCPSLDHVGVLARSVADLARVFDVVQGPDDADPHLAGRPFLGTADDIDYLPHDLRVGRAGGYFRDAGCPQANRAVDAVLEALVGPGGVGPTGGQFVGDVEVPEAARARAAAFLLTNAEAAAFHLPRLRGRPDDFDPETRDRLLAGALLPAAWVQTAQRFRRWFDRSMAEVFRGIDVLLAPATPTPALPIAATTMTFMGREVSARANIGVFTQPISFAGLPVVSVPVWLDGERLPIGVQVIAAPWREDVALKVARRLELLGTARAPIALIGN